MDVAARYLVAYKIKRDGTLRPKSSLSKERTFLNVYLIPYLGNAWIGDLDLPELNDAIRGMTLKDGTPASGSTKSTAASVLRRLFAWAREERIIPNNPALELRTGWGGSVRRRVLIPSIPQVLRLAEALDRFKPGLSDVAHSACVHWASLGRGRRCSGRERGSRRPVHDDRPDGERVRRAPRRSRGHEDAGRGAGGDDPRHCHASGAPTACARSCWPRTQRGAAVLTADQR